MALPAMRAQSLFRVAGTIPAVRHAALPLMSSRAAAQMVMMSQRRSASTDSLTAKENLALLNAQRERRPNSPHLTIYQPQLTWYLSMLNRITGVIFSFGLYGAAYLYLLNPIFPIFDSAHLVDLVHSMPGYLKSSLKFIIALPLTFHSWNGIRHLAWDMTLSKALSLKGVYGTGYAVLAATVLSSAYLAFFV